MKLRLNRHHQRGSTIIAAFSSLFDLTVLSALGPPPTRCDSTHGGVARHFLHGVAPSAATSTSVGPTAALVLARAATLLLLSVPAWSTLAIALACTAALALALACDAALIWLHFSRLNRLDKILLLGPEQLIPSEILTGPHIGVELPASNKLSQWYLIHAH